MQSLREQCRFELFKMTTKYDGKAGREQRHFPDTKQLPI
jgi:hypothetical protein